MEPFALDSAGRHVLVYDAPTGMLAFEHRGGDRRSDAHDALAEALRIDGLPIDPDVPRVRVEPPFVVGLALEDGSVLEVARFRADGFRGQYRLCPFELRYASDHGRLHPIPSAARTGEDVTLPITDLHSHYAGCVSGVDLVAIGVEHGIAYPTRLLAEAGVRSDREDDVPLAELPEGAHLRLAQALVVPPDKRITFVDMERIYRLRGPITKSPRTMPALLRRIALDYAGMGIRYVELSLGSLVQAETLRTIHAHVPAIEDETGVTLRFLLALSRHDDPEWDEDLLRRLATVGDSIYVAGIDVMGHETNSTRAFAPQLRAAAAWATRMRPGFVIRVHAGESPSHPENVRVAIEETAGSDIALRIGHGLYGVDDATLSLVVRSGSVVEMNLDSNVALNHIASGRDAPLRRYVDAGARLTLGSDGYGIYGASAESAARAALVSGLRPSDLAGAVRATEERVLARAQERDAAFGASRRSFVVPDDAPPISFVPAVVERRHAAALARERALTERLDALRIPVLSRTEIEALLDGRTLVSIAGAWQRSWDAMSAADQERIVRELAAFVDALDARAVVLVTGGTRYGVEGRLGALARARGCPVIGAIVGETSPGALDAGPVSHAHVVAPTLYEKGARLYELLDEVGGACVFVGGGQIVSDEIQAAKNLGLPYVVLDGVGASGAHARERPDRAVRSGAEAAYFVGALARPDGSASRARIAPHWFVGPNPTVDAVVLRTRDDATQVLLVRRSPDAPVAAGAWALPGGFIATDAPRGGPWRAGIETEEEACIRELREETALVITATRLRKVGIFEGGGRDPRDSARSSSRSTAFLVELDESEATTIAGGDDADDARWFPITALPATLAFDHDAILRAALASRGAAR